MTTARLSPVSTRAAASMTSPDAAGVAETVFMVSAATVATRVSRLAAAGKLVGAVAAAQLADALEQQRTTGGRFVRLDLSEVPMLDRLGFDVLVAAHHRFLADGGTLIMTGVGPRIRRLLELTGLDQTLFTIPRATDPPPPSPEEQTDRGLATAGSDNSTTHHQELSARAATIAAARAVIDQAVGVVMGRARCGVAEATERLVLLGQSTNCTLGEVAQSILDEPTGTRHRSIVTVHGRGGLMARDTPRTRSAGHRPVTLLPRSDPTSEEKR